METTDIEWADATVNIWWGCTKVSPACANCYAENLSNRFGKKLWGAGKPREDHRKSAIRLALKLEKQAIAEGRRLRVFANSMSDWLDEEVPIEWLADLLRVIRDTPNLDWLLLTKRPENWRARMLAAMALQDRPFIVDWLDMWTDGKPPHNVWIGTTVEDQARTDERIPLLLNIPAKVRFLSCEPLLEQVDLTPCFDRAEVHNDTGIHWVIVGGESGSKARAIHPAWALSLRDQCVAAGVPFFFKQWGEWQPMSTMDGRQELPFGLYLLPNPSSNGFGFLKTGKRKSGRTLDGQQWNQFPNPHP